ncbi:hypothetical protein BN11_1520016 [Nostocoides australiense Ben110]|uniref:Coenzyme PQQ synthesis protein D (PqqD) n=1 Tax=Nostocoides australiense Ben110 TaxID=1193182 RepID=W6JSX7_9MICO|nr:PqqD family protein [Tetrasphaera australiensis]CCH72303.1 hypothetical protein BN11_1520016 [Tetrasphaera australiensis Ben110]
MRRAPDSLWRSIPGTLVLARPGGRPIVALGPAAEIWGLLADDITAEQITQALLPRFAAEPETIRADVSVLLDRLEAEGHLRA